MPLSHAIPAPLAMRASSPRGAWLTRPERATLQTMVPPAATSDATDAALAAEEARLAQAAAGGDGGAFATLYERYERRAYNLAYRLTNSEDDAADAVQDAFVSVMRRLPQMQGRDLAFGSYLFTATRNASYDLMQKRKRTEPSDSIPETAAPIGAAAGGGFGLDPGDPDEDPDRKLLLESQQEEIRTANAALPERQREALALRELEELSYDEIAEIMDMNRNSVAQLISRARINLRDELRGTALASIAASSVECERALPLIALREDGQLEDGSEDFAWLDGHLGGCDTCRLGVEAMQEAGTSYRAWAPIAAVPWLFKETMAKAAELTGSDWSETIAERAATHDPASVQPGMPSPYLHFLAPVEEGSKRRRGIFAAAGLGAAALLAVMATAVFGGDDTPTPVTPAADTVAAPEPTTTDEPAAKPKKKHKAKKKQTASDEPTAPADDGSTPSQPSYSGGSTGTPSSGGSDPTPRKQVTPPSSDPPASDPVDPPPVVDEPPVVEEPPAADPPPTRGNDGPTIN